MFPTCSTNAYLRSAISFQALSEFVFEPAGGELRPLESKKVTVTFQPLTPRSVRRVIEITVEDGKDWWVPYL